MSNRLINEYGLDKLLECSLMELQKINGIGPAKAMQILTIAEIQKRINQSKKPIKRISCAQDVFDIFHDKLKDEKQENFYILMLNNKNYIIGEQLISRGILDSAIIHSREVFKPAIKNSASRIILVHNHPSGNPEPSSEDLEVTKQIVEAGELIGIKVLDHVIIGEGKWWSWEKSKN
ncbi:MAG: DNA repair protein RadC [Nanoarchaeota archaeon]|nr:DNA repair protein RadC [Nanoarchaeota archaeon]